MSWSPLLAFVTPVECLVLNFLGSTSTGWWWYGTPVLMFVSPAESIPATIGAGTRMFVSLVSNCEVVRTLVGPMAQLSTLVTVALLGVIWSCRS